MGVCVYVCDTALRVYMFDTMILLGRRAGTQVVQCGWVLVPGGVVRAGRGLGSLRRGSLRDPLRGALLHFRCVRWGLHMRRGHLLPRRRGASIRGLRESTRGYKLVHVLRGKGGRCAGVRGVLLLQRRRPADGSVQQCRGLGVFHCRASNGWHTRRCRRLLVWRLQCSTGSIYRGCHVCLLRLRNWR